MQLNGSTFIVTGASADVGGAIVRRLYAAGARLIIADSDDEFGERLAAELGRRAIFCETDATREADARAAVSEAQKHFGALNGLINCTGLGNAMRLGLQGMELFSHIVAINLIGAFNMIRMARAAMADGSPAEQRERGVVVNTVSPFGWHGQVEKAGFAACRAGLLSMSMSIACELSASGIRVVTVAPDRLQRPMVAAWPPAARDSLSETVPFTRRADRPEEYALLVQHVVEHETSTGEVTREDGLSQREAEVLRLVAQGKTNKEIGIILGISARTAQVHISNIYGKIGVGNRASAVLWLAERSATMLDHGHPSLEGWLEGGMPSALGIEWG